MSAIIIYLLFWAGKNKWPKDMVKLPALVFVLSY